MSVNKSRRRFLGQTTAAFAAVVLAPLAVACDDKAEKAVHTVEIKSFQFEPLSVKVKVGDTITWINHDIVPHTATAKDDSWDTGLIAAGDSKSVVVTNDMILDYYCRYHPMMIAKIELVNH